MAITLDEFKTIQREYFSSDKAKEPAITPESSWDDETNEEIFYEGSFRCVYRTEDGRGCAVGCAIPKELYDPQFDAENGIGVLSLPLDIRRYLGISAETERYYEATQWVHDDVALSEIYRDTEDQHFGRAFLARIAEIEEVSPTFFTTSNKSLDEIMMRLRY